MLYSAEISRVNPTLVLFLLDQSGSMRQETADGRSKARFLADVMNQTLFEIAMRCAKSDGVRDYFDVGLLVYCDDRVYSGFAFSPPGQFTHPISQIADNPLRMDTVRSSEPRPGGEVFEQDTEIPIWLDPDPNGNTPMKGAFIEAARICAEWCDTHPGSYPPTVINISDGVSTDGDPDEEARAIQQLETDDGPALLFNCHVSVSGGDPIIFPDESVVLPDDYARLLFSISSPFPDHLRAQAERQKFDLRPGARFFMYQASPRHVIHFLNLGTRPANLR